jgi:predicted ATPase
MRLTRVRAWNFKSFRELDIRLDPLNIVIGANASGKSNFVSLFQFIRDIAESGLENAVQMQGGAQYLRSMGCLADDRLTVELFAEADFPEPGVGLQLVRQTYRFSLAFNGGPRASVVEDELQGLSFKVTRGVDAYRLDGQNLVAGAFVEMMNARREAPGDHLLLESLVRYQPPFSILQSIGTYDINPKAPKDRAVFGGKSDLESDASNLAIVLERVLSDSDHRRDLLNLLNDVLPFARDLETRRAADGSVFFYLREKFSATAMPAAFLSDGTIDVLALLVILYSQPKSLVVIEEPERNLHPSIVPTLVHLLKDASAIKQIIVTTHNPEVVRYADPNQLILISRDESGSSSALRPADTEQVKKFLADELTMHELYIENLLEV